MGSRLWECGAENLCGMAQPGLGVFSPAAGETGKGTPRDKAFPEPWEQVLVSRVWPSSGRQTWKAAINKWLCTLFLESRLEFTYHFLLAKTQIRFFRWNTHFPHPLEGALQTKVQIAPGQSFALGKPCANNCSVYLVSLPGAAGSPAVYRVAEQLSSSSFVCVFERSPHGQKDGGVGVGSPALPWWDEHPAAAAAVCCAEHPDCSWLGVSESLWSHMRGRTRETIRLWCCRGHNCCREWFLCL